MTRLNHIRPGDVFLLRSRGYWYSDAIAWFMGLDDRGNEISHCGVVRGLSPDLGPVTLETSDYEVTYGALEKYSRDPEKYHLMVFKMPDATWDSESEMQSALAATDAEYYGSLYGYLQLLSLGLRRLLMRVGIKIANFASQGNVCTAVLLRFLSFSELPQFMGIDPESIDTVEAANLLYSTGAELIYESGRK